MWRNYIVQGYKIKQSSIFDLDELYKTLFRWFENNGYSFYEENYQDTDTPGGKQLQIYWRAEKKVDTYVMFAIEIAYLVTGLSKVEVERGGTKIKTNSGSIELRINLFMVKDYDDKWTKSGVGKNMRMLYDKFVARERLEKQEDQILGDYAALLDEIRSFLALHKF